MNGWEDIALLAIMALTTLASIGYCWWVLRIRTFCPFCRRQQPIKVYWFVDSANLDFVEIYCKRCGKMLHTTRIA